MNVATQLLAGAGIVALLWLLARGGWSAVAAIRRRTAARPQRVDDVLADHEARIAALEARVERIPLPAGPVLTTGQPPPLPLPASPLPALSPQDTPPVPLPSRPWQPSSPQDTPPAGGG